MKIKKLIAVVMSAATLLGFNCGRPFVSTAASTALPAPYNNLSSYLIKQSYLLNADNGYMRVYIPDEDIDNNIRIEYYDKYFNLISKKSVKRELEYWGGFFEGENNYFTVEGTKNTDEIDANEVVRVNKYDKNWNKLGTANITGNSDMFGGEIRYPLDYGCCEMTELNGNLYIAMGHQGYVDPEFNQGHQGLLLLMVDESDMTGQIADCDLWHSFAQYIDNDGSNLYLFENSEGSRRSQLTQYDPLALPADYFDSQNTANILEYGGDRTSAWSIPTYASCYGIAVSDKNVLTLGTSIDQEKYGEDYIYNVYLGITPKDNISTEATTVKWFTDLHDEDDSYYTGVNRANITKINNDRFMISWNQDNDESSLVDYNDPLSENILHYMFIDGEGNKVSKEFTSNAAFSDCRPIYDGSRIVFYASSGNSLDFYTIDAASGEFNKKAYKVLGENISWNYDNGVLTVAGTGEMNKLAANWYSDSAWPQELRNNVTKIVIKNGITKISDSAFADFDNLEEVVIEDGVESIGEKAFYECDNLTKITIPASVTSIGEDIIWTGYYWVGDESHVYQAKIYTEKGSEADKYAAKYDISCSYYTEGVTVDLGDVDSNGTIDALDASMVLMAYAMKATGKPSNLDTEHLKAADVNFDGNVDAFDASIILSYYAYKATGGKALFADYLMNI